MKAFSAKQICSLSLIALLSSAGIWVAAADSAKLAPDARQKPALTVTVAKPQTSELPLSLSANGSIMPWQEAIIGAELGGQRLVEMQANVGDVVQRGQVLAQFSRDSVAADLAQQEALVEEARAALSEAQSNAERARTLSTSGAMSAQQITQYMTAERSAQARLKSALARLTLEQIRLRQTQVTAPDDGVISARSATVGAVAQAGQELFKLIRKNRLEWRAEVTSGDLLRVKPGQTVRLLAANGTRLEGKVRKIAPSVDLQTRNALVYVDLPVGSEARAGMFASGEFELGRSAALTVPQSAVVLRDGFSFVFRVGGNGKVAQTKVSLGRRVQERVEVLNGITADTTLVVQGAGFLADGDTVKVVAPTTPADVSSQPLIDLKSLSFHLIASCSPSSLGAEAELTAVAAACRATRLNG